MNKFFIQLFMFFSLFHSVIYAQDGLFPYSSFGLGEVNHIGGVRNMGMGGVGVSTVSSFYSNLQNPATLTYNKLTLFDFSLRGDWIELQTEQEILRAYTVSITHLNLIFPISSRITTTIGLRPATNVDYRSTTIERIPNSPSYARYTSTGEGGIRQLYLGTGISFSKNFAVGLDIIYNFGKITSKEQSQVIDISTDTKIGYVNHIDVNKLTLDFGLLYDAKIKENKKLYAGIVYTPSFRYNFTHLQTLSRDISNNLVLFSDTIINNDNKKVRLPDKWSFGLSLNQDLKYNLAIDVILENWSVFKGLTSSSDASNTYKINLGGEWTPSIYSINFFKKITYRTGFSYGSLPWNIEEKKVNEWSISLGFSFPLKNFTLLNYAVSYHKRLTKANFVDIQYIRMNFGIIINSRWFIKRKFD